MNEPADELLRLVNVSKTFHVAGSPPVRAVRGVTLGVRRGETVAIIGESGSGKSTLARLALGLTAPDEGNVHVGGEDLTGIPIEKRRKRSHGLAFVFQEPYESLDPRMKVERTLLEPLHTRGVRISEVDARRRVDETLELVMLSPDMRHKYPLELSGGQQQRVGIARALMSEPDCVILDEPTASLDLSVQAQILLLLEKLQESLGVAYLFITHNIDAAAYLGDRIAVMYRGRVMELGPAQAVLDSPGHEYTRSLLAAELPAVPDPDRPAPSPVSPETARQWAEEEGELVEIGPGHVVRRPAHETSASGT